MLFSDEWLLPVAFILDERFCIDVTDKCLPFEWLETLSMARIGVVCYPLRNTAIGDDSALAN